MAHSKAQHSGKYHLGHIVPKQIYVTVLATLIFLTVVTVVISRFDFGNMNLVVAMLVASIKASLVAMFFMHLKYESPITWLYVFFPIILLALMLGGVFIDNPLRHEPVPAIGNHQVTNVTTSAPAQSSGHGSGH
jgi:cytochrome c oxidase subunit 4